MEAGARRRWLRIGLKVGAVLLGLVILYVGGTFVQVWQASREDQAREAGAIVVMGAAQYDGDPSPVYEARLEHGLELWQEGISDRVVVTGGRQEGDGRAGEREQCSEEQAPHQDGGERRAFDCRVWRRAAEGQRDELEEDEDGGGEERDAPTGDVFAVEDCGRTK